MLQLVQQPHRVYAVLNTPYHVLCVKFNLQLPQARLSDHLQKDGRYTGPVLHTFYCLTPVRKTGTDVP